MRPSDAVPIGPDTDLPGSSTASPPEQLLARGVAEPRLPIKAGTLTNMIVRHSPTYGSCRCLDTTKALRPGGVLVHVPGRFVWPLAAKRGVPS